MEVPDVEGKTGSHTTLTAAFVAVGIQEACDDACCICLEDYCESDPATVTNCKHEFHLQCILEWCQRSSHCPMCWQSFSLKDGTSQELLEAVEQERRLRDTPSRNATIFHHPSLGGFELQHLQVAVNDADFEERIIQHLASAAATRRACHLGLREGHRTRSSAHGHTQLHMYSTQPSGLPSCPKSAAGEGNEPAAIPVGSPSTPLKYDGDEPSPLQRISHFQAQSSSSLAHGSTVLATNRPGMHSNDRGSNTRSSTANQDRAGPSEFLSFSDSLRSKFTTMSQRYKESISKGTRGWKERLLSRNSSMSAAHGSEVKRESNAGITSASRLMERHKNRENNRASGASLSNHLPDSSIMGTSNRRNNGQPLQRNSLHDRITPTTLSASSDSN